MPTLSASATEEASVAYCSNCGTQMSDDAPSCPQCGHPRRREAGAVGGRQTEGTAVASLVLGIAGLVVCPLICSILAVIFGNQAQTRIRQNPTLEGDSMAKAGIILGWVGIALVSLGILITVVVFALAIPTSFSVS